MKSSTTSVVVPLWPRLRGRRRTPSRRARAPADPYGSAHRKIRVHLLALLAATGPWPCPLCGEAMHAWMGRSLHLHHSNPESKLAGLPGDELAHARCNIRDGGKLGAAITNGQPAGTGAQRPARLRSRAW